MVKTLLIISLALMIGTAGVTVAAAKGSQPGESINAIKAWSEQASTLLQTRSQVQAMQKAQQPEADPGQQDRDRTRLQTQDMQQAQERDRIRLQVQDLQQTQECDCNPSQTQVHDRIRLQIQDVQQTQEHDHGSLNSGQQNRGNGQPGSDYGNKP